MWEIWTARIKLREFFIFNAGVGALGSIFFDIFWRSIMAGRVDAGKACVGRSG